MLKPYRRSLTVAAWASLPMALSLMGCAKTLLELNAKPSFVDQVIITDYNGSTDDLLTAGLGWDGLQSDVAPGLSAPPAASELRRLAIYRNYRALIDMTSDGGYGRLYGPNVSLAGSADPTPGAGKIAGTEYLAYNDDGTGTRNVTMLTQIPANFDRDNACIVAAVPSGSRGVYGAIAAVGEWALKHGCAVVYHDKGAGNGAHELRTDTVLLIDGTTANGTQIASQRSSQFNAGLSSAERQSFNQATPNRYAFKHAHSRQNPEQDWGRLTLQSIEFALWAINQRFAEQRNGTPVRRYNAGNTLVIAAGVSNGGGAVLAAAEQDSTGLIDGVVAGEPQINLPANVGDGTSIQIRRGGNAVGAIGKPLFDYMSLANLLQPCAAFATSTANAPFLTFINATDAQNRCARLASDGLINGGTFTARANDALAQLHAAGWEDEADLTHASSFGFSATSGVAVTYANAYGRASVTDNLCAFSFATTNNVNRPDIAALSPMNSLFGEGNGIAPTAGINLVYNAAAGGAVTYQTADNDFAFAGAQCLRDLWVNTGATNAIDVHPGIDAVRVTGNLRGKPALIVHGRSDGFLPPNHTSRPYWGLNKNVEGRSAKLGYIEVTNAQHFDSFIGLRAGADPVPPFAPLYVPLHYYNLQALDALWNHLKNNTDLPTAQVVRTTPRGAGAPPLTVNQLPAIQTAPALGDQIGFSGNTVTVPN